MILDLIENHKLSVIHATTEDPQVEQVWHVISPHVREKQPRISATNASLHDAVLEVVSQITKE